MARRKPSTKPALGEYRRKRDFERTTEPSGGDVRRSASGRLYAIQKHAARQLHYDLRLEHDGVLLSWALPRGPSLDPAQKPLAVHVEDHPIEYGEFEGVIPKGEYGAGTVMLWDRGEWEPINDPAEGLARGDLKFRLHGEKLRGEWVLARMGGKAGADGRNWLLIKKKDAEARPVELFNVQSECPFSVLSGRTMEAIAKDPEAVWTDGRAQPLEAAGAAAPPRRAEVPDPGALPGARRAKLPARFSPQLAGRARAAPEGDQWIHEIKLDGYRMLCRIEDGRAALLTRNGHDWTDRLPDVARAAERLGVDEAILDGEVVILDPRGVSDFQALQNAFRGYRQGPFTYYVFDAPFAAGCDLRKVPLVQRKAYLEALLGAAPFAAPTIRYCDHIAGRGPVVFAEAKRAGLEGIISKRADAPYESRRSDGWLKVKATRREEFVIGGYTVPEGGRTGFGALLIGQHDASRRLVYCGRVGTGFSERTLESLHAELAKRQRDEPPFINPEADPEPRAARWVEPELVCSVEFTAWTNEGLVRHASFAGLREDVAPRQAMRERPARRVARVVKAPSSPEDAFVAGVRISHPQRTVYPEAGFTKLDVARYYEAVADWMLPYVARRPLSLVRCPLGLAGESFYQREPGEGFPEPLRGVAIGRGESEDHAIAIDGLDGLLSLAQMGVLEIHAWGCREDNPEKPDHLVFDLDPGPGIEWAHVVASAEVLRDRLAGLGLASFVKTSGGKGLHVVVPVVRRAGWEDVKAFARGFAEGLARMAPLNFVATMSKSLRKYRIFIDYLRNQKGATSIAPYSTRARPGAPVSTPLSWDELSPELTPESLTIETVQQRLAGLDADPWAGYRDTRQSITKKLLKQVTA